MEHNSAVIGSLIELENTLVGAFSSPNYLVTEVLAISFANRQMQGAEYLGMPPYPLSVVAFQILSTHTVTFRAQKHAGKQHALGNAEDK